MRMPRPLSERLESAALRLPRAERARLAERLIASLGEDAETELRMAELRGGRVKPIPGEEVFGELEDLFQ